MLSGSKRNHVMSCLLSFLITMKIILIFCSCVLSFIGVYYITSDRKQEESDEQLLLTNADLFPGMLICHMGGVDVGSASIFGFWV